MRILIFWDYFQNYHCARIRALADMPGVQVIAVALRASTADAHQLDYVHTGRAIVVMPACDSSQESLFLAHNLNLYKPDVVGIIGWFGAPSWLSLLWCKLYGARAILMLETQKRDEARIYWKEVIKRFFLFNCDGVFAGGTSHACYAISLGMNPNRVTVGYDAVDNNFWAAESDRIRARETYWRELLGLPPSFFLCVGRMIPKKNHEGLIKEYADYCSHVGVDKAEHLILIGDGPLRGDLEKLVYHLGLQSKIHFKGYLLPKKSVPYYALATVFILPSAYSEQWGLVVNESLACGTPVIVSEVAGSSHDLVKDDTAGLVFDPYKKGELLSCFQIISKRCGRGNVSAIRAAVEEFSCENWSRKFMSLTRGRYFFPVV